MKKDRVQRWAYFVIALIVMGVSYRGFLIYHDIDLWGGDTEFLLLATGHALAPFQYRIGVIQPAYLLYRHGVPFRWDFGLFDLFSYAIALSLGYRLLTQKQMYRTATLQLRVILSSFYCGRA